MKSILRKLLSLRLWKCIHNVTVYKTGKPYSALQENLGTKISTYLTNCKDWETNF